MRGYMLRQFTDANQTKPVQPIGKTYRRLSKYVWDQRLLFVGATATVLVVSFLQLIVPQLTRITIDEIIPHREFGRIWLVVAGILGTALMLGIMAFIRSYLMSVIGQRVIYALRNAIYQHIQTLSMSFFDKNRTGDLMSRVTNDVNQLQQLITSGVMDIFTDLVTFVTILALLLYTDWQLTSLILLTFPFMVITTQRFGRRIRGAYRQVQDQMASINDHLQETISGIRVVKSFANESYEMNRFEERSRQSMEANINAVKLWSIFFPIIDLMNQLGTVVILGFGARQVMIGRLTTGALVAFLSYLGQLQQPIRRFGRIMNVIQQAAAAGERIFEVLDARSDVVEKPDAIELPRINGKIVYEHVSFSYDKENTVLYDFTLTIEPGMSVALVGPSGAGKTTVANLLTRFYDPDKGRITVDGHDLRDVTSKSLRSQMGIVSQEILLLNGTVRDNIAYGKPGASPEEIEAAAKAANAHDFIMELPNGYDSLVGERGVRLSGGQRQRIAIARAILKDPRILILDEATSQLDSEAEHLIQEALGRLLEGRTSLVIAHRLSTIKRADLIVVMQDGRIIETGKHDELLAVGGRYASLYNIQYASGE